MMMRAIVLREFGGPQRLQVEQVPIPDIAATDVLVRVRAVSINRTLDLAVRAGRFMVPVKLPLVPGVDPAGEVTQIGAAVANFKAGDRVVVTGIRCGECRACVEGDRADCQGGTMIGVQRWGGAAEYIAVPAASVQTIPDELDFATAVYTARHGGLAMNILRTKARLKAEESVLITGAAGALGTSLVQVGAALGAHVVAAAGNLERAQACCALGASAAIDYRSSDLTSAAMAANKGRGFDVVVDTTGDADIWTRAFASLGHRGRLVSMAASGDGHVDVNLRQLYARRQSIIGAAGSNADDVGAAFDLARTGRLRAVIARKFPLDAYAQAHELLERGSVTGKIIIEP